MKRLLKLLVGALASIAANPIQAVPLENRSFESGLAPSWVVGGGNATTPSNFFGIAPTHGAQMMGQLAVGHGLTVIDSTEFSISDKSVLLIDVNILFSELQPGGATAASALAVDLFFPIEVAGRMNRQISIAPSFSAEPDFWVRRDFKNGQNVNSKVTSQLGPPGSGFASQSGWITLEMDISDLPPIAGYSLQIFTDGAQDGTSMLGLIDNIRFLPLSADFDGDGDVDGRDFLAWQRGGSDNPLSSIDLESWQAEYGDTASPLAATTSIPEPSSILILFVAASIWACYRSR